MYVSLNEIDYAVKRAARGAGEPWGYAEEAGFTARFLAGRRLPWLELFVALLENPMGASPIITAAHLSDAGPLPATALGPMRAPLLLVPQLARAFDGLSVHWPGASLVVASGNVHLRETSALAAASVPQVTLAPAAPEGPAVEVHMTGIDVPDALWSRLNHLVWRTYVPASKTSRLKGAGAGLRDDD